MNVREAKRAFVGVDVGTTSCRAVAFGEDGRVLGRSQVEYPFVQERPGWAEHDPEMLFQAVVSSVAGCVAGSGLGPSDVAAVGLGTYWHSLIAVDAAGRPLTRCITWADVRASKEAERLRVAGLAREFYERTGCPVHQMYLPAKLLWLKERMPEVFRAASRFACIKDYLVHRLCGEYWVDVSVATASGLLNLQTYDWDERVLDTVGVEPERLGEVVRVQTVLPRLEPAVAAAMGIDPSTPMVVGGGDGALSSLGSGAVDPGVMAAMIGTSGAMRVIVPAPAVDPQSRTWCYGFDDGAWVAGGAINNGGIVYRWFRDQLAPEERRQAAERGVDVYEIINEWVESVPLGAGGLVFLPYLTGERCPYWNANARGVLFGLSLDHTRRHIARAAMEGICFRMAQVLRAMEDVTGPAREIRATGGFTRSKAWLQMLADVLGREVVVPASHEGSALGAAILAMDSVLGGGYAALSRRLSPVTARYVPGEENNRRYKDLMEIYIHVYRNVSAQFDELAEFRRRAVD
ncbi:MAG: gluconokinase [Firmicutes bacterium]|nr:gluconokinase [Bacillota bacterium]